MLWVALEYFQNPKFHIPSSKIEWTTAIWRFELQKVKVLRKWHCRTATAVASATGVRISNGLFRMFCMIHKHHLKPWNHIQKFFPVPLLTDWLVEGHLSVEISSVRLRTKMRSRNDDIENYWYVHLSFTLKCCFQTWRRYLFISTS